jgi:hypothetical protein
MLLWPLAQPYSKAQPIITTRWQTKKLAHSPKRAMHNFPKLAMHNFPKLAMHNFPKLAMHNFFHKKAKCVST